MDLTMGFITTRVGQLTSDLVHRHPQRKATFGRMFIFLISRYVRDVQNVPTGFASSENVISQLIKLRYLISSQITNPGEFIFF